MILLHQLCICLYMLHFLICWWLLMLNLHSFCLTPILSPIHINIERSISNLAPSLHHIRNIYQCLKVSPNFFQWHPHCCCFIQHWSQRHPHFCWWNPWFRKQNRHSSPFSWVKSPILPMIFPQGPSRASFFLKPSAPSAGPKGHGTLQATKPMALPSSGRLVVVYMGRKGFVAPAHAQGARRGWIGLA